MNVIPKKKKSIRGFFQNLKKTKKETPPVNEEINMNVQEPTEEEIDMNVIPKKKKGIRSFFQNLKKTKKGTTPVNEEINMNIQEPTQEEIDMNVMPKKKKGIRGFFQNLKAKVMKKFNSELKESTTKMDIANATLFTIIQGIILTGTIVYRFHTCYIFNFISYIVTYFFIFSIYNEMFNISRFIFKSK